MSGSSVIPLRRRVSRNGIGHNCRSLPIWLYWFLLWFCRDTIIPAWLGPRGLLAPETSLCEPPTGLTWSFTSVIYATTIRDDRNNLATREHNPGSLLSRWFERLEMPFIGTWATHESLAQDSRASSSPVQLTLPNTQTSFFVKHQDNNCDTIFNPGIDVLARSARRALG
jgi:hypothetical protein